ncbi:MAG: endonuclease III, partial [Deltaproteobacteria bacterium]|nr:endonuclease III [Deltaproteobacteria bacterium]
MLRVVPKATEPKSAPRRVEPSSSPRGRGAAKPKASSTRKPPKPSRSASAKLRRISPKLRAHADAVLDALKRAVPAPVCELDHADAWTLLVATILSAQSTDKMVNRVTPSLFERWPTPRDLAEAAPGEVEHVIHPTGFFRAKTKSIQGTARALVERFGGAVPRTMEEITSLPGVARKTGNVVLGTAYRIATGVTVDTHVTRVANRLRLTKQTDPVKIEADL